MSTSHSHQNHPFPDRRLGRRYNKKTQLRLKAATTSFLRLPGELRNQIYEHVLTSTEVLHFVPGWRNGKPILVDDSKELNQIKYVSRFLYNETAGLEAKYNVVEFHDNFPREHGPATKFCAFTAKCIPFRASWFTSIILRVHFDPFRDEGARFRLGRRKDGIESVLDQVLEPRYVLTSVANFCQRNPSVHIRYIVGGFHCLPAFAPTFLYVGAYLSMAIYHKDVRPVPNPSDLRYYPWSRILNARHHVDARGVAKLTMPNLRFFPAQNEIWYGDFDLWVSPPTLRLWKPIMEDWIKNGF